MSNYVLLPKEASRAMVQAADAAVKGWFTSGSSERDKFMRKVWAVMVEVAQQEMPPHLKPGALLRHMEGPDEVS